MTRWTLSWNSTDCRNLFTRLPQTTMSLMLFGLKSRSSRRKDPLRTSHRPLQEMNPFAKSIQICSLHVKKLSTKKKQKIQPLELSMEPNSTDLPLHLSMPSTSRVSSTTRERWIWLKELTWPSSRSLKATRQASHFWAKLAKSLAAQSHKIPRQHRLSRTHQWLLSSSPWTSWMPSS